MGQRTSLSDTQELMLVVERLSAQDQGRIVRLIDLLRLAPDSLRERTQEMLKDMIYREPRTHAECLAFIDRVISRAERELEGQLSSAGRVDGVSHAANGVYGFPRKSS